VESGQQDPKLKKMRCGCQLTAPFNIKPICKTGNIIKQILQIALFNVYKYAYIRDKIKKIKNEK